MTRSWKTAAISALACATLLLSACSGGGGGASGNTIEAKKGAFAFIPTDFKVKANAATAITFNNPDAVAHDWTIDAVEVGGKVEKIQLKAAPGQKASNTFTFTKAGTYPVYCAEPGHKEAGMVGKLIVE